ncbi:hypothetical protein BGW36DRAFT_389041 [Talaromyces proteolyticus]|uniref:SMP domain-containing protein n=1 Tax=Talaromyces proteolyticus TaxID=1131652 RepID=A0AAD4PTC3_9EURO|nr:uncharacterized protein BGW36DRAFT_389041 [Talaromyces proteolyticus]KAH8690606.1 hypothetical protein BGW36DRAFT_389041 [Talaromyces proteolyticus]
MSNDLPTVNEIKRAVVAGQRITPEDVSQIAQAENELTGRGPIKGGPAATAHSLSSKQMNFEAKLDELAHKPPSHITQEDAREMQSAEGRAFNAPPGAASVSAQVRSLADRNEVLGLPAVQDPGPVYVTKEEASEAQATEAMYTVGMVPKGSLAAQMQSAADKREAARNGVLWDTE